MIEIRQRGATCTSNRAGKSGVLILLVVGLSVGCSPDPKKPSTAVFEQGIRQALDKFGPSPRCPLQYPPEIFQPTPVQSAGYPAIEEAGLAELYTMKLGLITWRTYRLTEKGRPFALTSTGEPPKEPNYAGYLCVGKAKIEVTGFSEPAPMMGRQVTQVNFRIQISEVYDWAKSEPILALFKSAKAPIDAPRELKFPFYLTDKGWEPMTSL